MSAPQARPSVAQSEGRDLISGSLTGRVPQSACLFVLKLSFRLVFTDFFLLMFAVSHDTYQEYRTLRLPVFW